jgi:hypothetical protein
MINKEELIEWIKEFVDSEMVPSDEGLTEGLVYNMVQFVLNDNNYNYQHWNYEEDQQKDVDSWLKNRE